MWERFICFLQHFICFSCNGLSVFLQKFICLPAAIYLFSCRSLSVSCSKLSVSCSNLSVSCSSLSVFPEKVYLIPAAIYLFSLQQFICFPWIILSIYPAEAYTYLNTSHLLLNSKIIIPNNLVN